MPARSGDGAEIIVVSYGGGTNSTAMLVGLWERGEKVDAILFSDTGGEKPHTYEFIATMTEWLVRHGMPPVTILRGSQPQQIKDGSLEAECVRLGMLPSKVYGYGACSQKWKVDPQMRWIKRSCGGELPTVLVGFDADEPERAERRKAYDGKETIGRYPLIEWGWGREECVAAIERAGLPQPGKSACFFCPSSKKNEIMQLRDQYPDLFARALEMERRALAGEGPAPALRAEGLGRHFAWADLAKMAEAQLCLFSDAGTPEVDCGCYDG